MQFEMDTEVAVKPEPMWLVEDEEALPCMKTESVPVSITFPCVKRELIMQDMNHVDAKNEAVLSAEICYEGNRMLKSDTGIEAKSLLDNISECNYSAEEMNTAVTVKPESMGISEHEEMSQAHVKDEGIVSAVDCDEINEEFKTEIDIENCILGDSSEFIQCCKVAGDAKVLGNEGIIISSTDNLHAVEGHMLEYEDQVNVNVEETRERKISINKYSHKVHDSFSKCSLKSEKQFKCYICGNCFRSHSSIVEHLNTHTLLRPFKCKECNKYFTQSRSLQIHMRWHTGEKPFKCKECSKCFTSSSYLKRHVMRHTGEKPFKCKECSKGFTESSHLKEHLTTHTGEKPFKCKECNVCFTFSRYLKIHMRLHTGEKPFKCKECSKCYTSSSDLKKHMRSHTGERPFKCKECCKCFTRSGHLKIHMRLHTGEMPFKCKECSVSFKQSGNLKVHMRLHTGEKPFKCKECSMCFKQSSNLQVHMRLHTGEKPFNYKEFC